MNLLLRLAFERCPDCKGAGCTRMTMPLTPVQIYALAKITPNEPVAVVKEWCKTCGGTGRIGLPGQPGDLAHKDLL